MNTLYKFLCEQPLKEHPSCVKLADEEQLSIKFCKRILNCQVEEETVAHIQGGKGFAIIEKNISEECGSSQFYEWKVKVCFCVTVGVVGFRYSNYLFLHYTCVG